MSHHNSFLMILLQEYILRIKLFFKGNYDRLKKLSCFLIQMKNFLFVHHLMEGFFKLIVLISKINLIHIYRFLILIFVISRCFKLLYLSFIFSLFIFKILISINRCNLHIIEDLFLEVFLDLLSKFLKNYHFKI
jgi:hypothetical protein